ncbi:MAG: hypothetical protein ACKOPM_07685 [Novosphingobium sp.]
MFMLIGLLIMVAIPAALAAAIAFALPTLAPRWSLRRRTAVAALTAGFLPMLLPIIAALSDEKNPAVFASVAGILFGGLFFSAVIGLPVALLIGRRKGKADPDPAAFD